MTFFESLEASARLKGGPLCVGIDPRIDPSEQSATGLLDYGRRVVDACAPFAAAFKPQIAFFERHGPAGWEALDSLLDYIRSVDENFPVVLDAKRGDIGSTAKAYAEALLGRPGCLAVTLSPYLGYESAAPFLDMPGAGIFVLCRTTNPGAERLQERCLDDGQPLYLSVADEVASWGAGSGTNAVGLVVAGNRPHVLESVRRRHPDLWILAPGIGAQGGDPDEAFSHGVRADGLGLLVSASRSVADAPDPAAAAEALRDTLDAVRRRAAQPGQAGQSPFGTRSPALAASDLSKASPQKARPRPEEKDRLELLAGLFTLGAFRTGEFTLKSGTISPFYIDLRRISSDPRMLRLAGRAYAGLLREIHADHVAGIPVAALPLAAAAALEADMSLIYPRLEKKAHGSGACVEGVWSPKERAVLLDDLITTGGSKREAVGVLRSAGLIVDDLVVLVERGDEGRRDMEQAGIRLRSWASLEDVTAAGVDAGHLDRDTAHKILVFSRNGAQEKGER